MENSMSSCVNKPIASKGTTKDCPEESGWTAYFEDFSSYRENSFSSSFGTSSLVSDAASSAAWKITTYNDLKTPKRLSFKKTRTKVISVDDSLEDTASSPVNSPKVSDLERPVDHMNPRKAHHDPIISSLGKGSALEHFPELQADERSCETNFSGKNNDSTDLRKRGLCLVPLSKLVNYFG